VRRKLAIVTFAAALTAIPATASGAETANGCRVYGDQLSHAAAKPSIWGEPISELAKSEGNPLAIDREEDCQPPGTNPTGKPDRPPFVLEDIPANPKASTDSPRR
jgi:hypothetical protein